MKTKKMRLIALMITFAAVMTGVNAQAQHREYHAGRQNPAEKRQEAVKKQDKREYHKPDTRRERESYSQHYRKPERRDEHGKWKGEPKHYDHYKYDKRYEYEHPKYGHVYKHFHEKPIRLRHSHGDYYFYGGRYYNHVAGIGYVHVAFPRNLVYAELPFRCERVWVGHRVYYRYGDLFFERCDLGYRLAPNVSIHLSANF